MKTAEKNGNLIFLPGVCWGGLWIKEFFSYPEAGFFAFAALLTGAGFAAMRLLPHRFRTPAMITGTAALLFVPYPDLKTLLLPLVFGGTYAHSLKNAIDNWRASRQLCGGIILGAVAAMLIPEKYFAVGMLFCTAVNLSGLKLKFAATAAAAVAANFLPVPAPHTTEISPGAVMTALSWVKSDTVPLVVFSGGNEALLRRNSVEILPAAHLRFPGNLSGKTGKADLLIAPALPEISDGGITNLTRHLKEGGVLVIPRKYCAALPEFSWLILPGSNGTLAAGAKGRKLQLNPDEMDAVLAGFFRGKESAAPLRGTLAGMLVTETEIIPEKLPFTNKRAWWLTGMGAAAVIMAGYIFSRSRKMANPEFFRIMLNCGGYAFMAAVFLPLILNKIDFPGAARLFTVMTAAVFLRRPTLIRNRFTRSQGLLSVLAAIMALNGNVLWLLAALLCGGYACAELDGDLRTPHDNIEPARFFAVACGLAAAWGITLLQLPLPAIIAAVGAIRFYSWFRN